MSRFRALGPEFAGEVEDDFDRELRQRLNYGIEVETFLGRDPVGQRLYRDLKDRAIDAAVKVIFADTPEAAKAVIDERYHEFRLATVLIDHFMRALNDAERASDKLMNPPPPTPET